MNSLVFYFDPLHGVDIVASLSRGAHHDSLSIRVAQSGDRASERRQASQSWVNYSYFQSGHSEKPGVCLSKPRVPKNSLLHVALLLLALRPGDTRASKSTEGATPLLVFVYSTFGAHL